MTSRALITGGASGIGLATALELRRGGANVAVLDMQEPPAEHGLLAVVGDVSDEASVRPAVEAAIAQLGGLDILVNNAGIGAIGTLEETPDDEWHRVYDVNVVGIVRVTRAALPALRLSSHASIVNTCSIAARVGLVRRAAYSATKGAVLALTLAMAADYIAEGIRVNCVNPGTVATPWVLRLLEQADDPAVERANLEARQPHGRLVTPEEVADAIAYLARPSAGSTTGCALDVDGGLATLRLPPAARA